MKLAFRALIVMLISLNLLFYSLLPMKAQAEVTQQGQEVLQLNKLNYIFARAFQPKGQPFLFSPDSSDITDNQLILNTLIGTLVRYGPTGVIEPSLAKSWKVSPNELVWEFELRPNLKCEDGEIIDAPSYVLGLKRLFLNLPNNSKVMAFNHLEGWELFIKERKDLGLRAIGINKIEFKFSEKVENFLDTLRMVRFGYWCSENFKDGKFNEKSKFISSGPYDLISKTDDNFVKLKKAERWFEATPEEVKEIKFEAKKINASIDSYKNTIIRLGLLPPIIEDKDKFNIVQSPPNFLTAFVLSPYIKNGIFNSLKNRHIFQNRLLKIKYSQSLKDANLYEAKFFYQSGKSKVNIRSQKVPRLNYSGQEVNINTPFRFGENVTEIFKKLIYQILPEIPKNKLHFNDSKFSNTDYYKRLMANDYFDIRIESVDIDNQVTNSGSGIEMMFCTKLGVNFPDESGAICKLSYEYSKAGKNVDQIFINRFNQLLYDEAIILPYFHIGLTWLYSKDIDTKTIPTPSIGYPIFERIKFHSE